MLNVKPAGRRREPGNGTENSAAPSSDVYAENSRAEYNLD